MLSPNLYCQARNYSTIAKQKLMLRTVSQFFAKPFVVRSWLLSYRRKAAKEKGRTATCNKFLSLHNFLSSQNKEQMFVVRWLAVAQ